MASLLRQRIEKNITKEDVLQVKLQGLVHDIVKKSMRDSSLRKKTIYRLLRDKKILALPKKGRFDKAVNATIYHRSIKKVTNKMKHIL